MSCTFLCPDILIVNFVLLVGLIDLKPYSSVNVTSSIILIRVTPFPFIRVLYVFQLLRVVYSRLLFWVTLKILTNYVIKFPYTPREDF